MTIPLYPHPEIRYRKERVHRLFAGGVSEPLAERSKIVADISPYPTVCAWCKDELTPNARWLARRWGVRLSHGICEPCKAKLERGQYDPPPKPAA